MKIWIDITNSPHVNFFAGMIEQLKNEHELLITCRPLSNTIDLLKLKGIKFTVVGRHYGGGQLKKAIGFPVRIMQLVLFLLSKRPDVAISHSSFYSPVVARILGVRSIYINDNEHAIGNRISFLCASTVMVPEFLSMDSVCRQWCNPKKVIRYPGVKEGIYLADVEGTCVTGNKSDKPEIFIRPEPWTAQYYHGAVNFMDDLIIELKEKYRILLMPRGGRQAEYYRKDPFRGVEIPAEPMTLTEVATRCSLFIGAGGTMTREAAVLGIPTISVYQDELLAVDKYLIKEGYLIHEKALKGDRVEKYLAETLRKLPCKELLRKGAIAADLIQRILLSGPGNAVVQG